MVPDLVEMATREKGRTRFFCGVGAFFAGGGGTSITAEAAPADGAPGEEAGRLEDATTAGAASSSGAVWPPSRVAGGSVGVGTRETGRARFFCGAGVIFAGGGRTTVTEEATPAVDALVEEEASADRLEDAVWEAGRARCFRGAGAFFAVGGRTTVATEEPAPADGTPVEEEALAGATAVDAVL